MKHNGKINVYGEHENVGHKHGSASGLGTESALLVASRDSRILLVAVVALGSAVAARFPKRKPKCGCHVLHSQSTPSK